MGNILSDRQENAKVIEVTGDQEITVGNPGSSLTASETVVNVKTLERCFNERIDKEMGNNNDTVDNGIQNAILTQWIVLLLLSIVDSSQIGN